MPASVSIPASRTDIKDRRFIVIPYLNKFTLPPLRQKYEFFGKLSDHAPAHLTKKGYIHWNYIGFVQSNDKAIAMKKILLGLTVITCLAILSIISCNKEKPGSSPTVPGSSPTVKTEKSILLGEFTPYRVESTNNEVTVGFLQSARLFKLNQGEEKDNEYLNLLRSALEKDLPVKVTIYEGTSGISEVHQSPAPSAQKYKAAE